jgi:integrase
MSKLTALEIRLAKPQNKPIKLPDGHGLYFHISKSGKKTWRYRYKILGKESTFTLGEYPKMSLTDARKARTAAREKVQQGINPSKERRKMKQAAQDKDEAAHLLSQNTFEFIALEWIGQQLDAWSSPHAAAVLSSLKSNVLPFLGDIPIEAITPPMILQILRSIESRGSLEVARKILQRITAVFRYAIQTGRATYNPASDMKGVLKTRKVVHMPAISKSDLPDFLRKLSTGDIHTTTKLALQFTIQTAARTGEVRGATWQEIDFKDNIWRIPAQRMKMDVPHNIPLSTQALAILERMERMHGRKVFIFPGIRQGSKQLSENTMLYALYRLGYHSKATVHGFRATFSTIANEADFNGDVIEKALAHEERNQVRAAYHRSEYIEQRRILMQWWGDLLQMMAYGEEPLPIIGE